MDECPNCQSPVELTATRCQRCGLPRNVPVYGEDGSQVGTTFAQPPGVVGFPGTSGGAGSPGTGPSGAGFAFFDSPRTGDFTEPPAPGRRRSTGRTVLITVVALAVALALGVGSAIVINNVRQRPDPPPPPPPSSGSPSPTAAPPTTEPPEKPEKPEKPAPPPIDKPAVLAKVGPGIVTVVATGCDGSEANGAATGFLVGADRVVTSWSGVGTPAAAAVLTADGTPYAATVEQAYPEHGLVVLRTARPVSGGTPLTVDATTPAAGLTSYGITADARSRTAAAFVDLPITDLTGRGTVDGREVTGVGTSSTAAGATLGGGPVVDHEGRVAGVVLRYGDALLVVGGDRLQQVLDAAPQTTDTDCDRMLGPQGELPLVQGSQPVLEAYFASINRGDYAATWGLLSPNARGGSQAEAAAGWATSYDFNIVIDNRSDGTYDVRFDSIFARGKGPEPGLTCARWHLVYTIIDGRIDRARAPEGGQVFTGC
ncbi:S1 family peptidase [Propionibacteriaceae bacterium Y2011]|uniref:S1 family peptidase n=1 Tax=Microlunatus sp. Y2014 TaxID=3418488 RepID=UPI003B4856F4